MVGAGTFNWSSPLHQITSRPASYSIAGFPESATCPSAADEPTAATVWLEFPEFLSFLSFLRPPFAEFPVFLAGYMIVAP
jgi:hypothetical protein